MTENTKKKLKLTIAGYILTFINIYLTYIGQNLLALVPGLLAIHFFIESIKIKSE